MTKHKELVEALRVRYRSAAFGDRIKILDEFVALTKSSRRYRPCTSDSGLLGAADAVVALPPSPPLPASGICGISRP